LLDRANKASSPKAQRLKGFQSVVNKFRYMVISVECQKSCSDRTKSILQQKTSQVVDQPLFVQFVHQV
jgi:hypothetical protein